MAAVSSDADVHRRAQQPHGGLSQAGRPSLDALTETPLSAATTVSDTQQKSPGQGTHQRFVLTDPVAFRYLEQDPSTTVLQRRKKLEGYDCYIVEQWACSRAHPTFVITTYTGDSSNSVIVGVLSIPKDERAWSPQMKIYFKALDQYHARRRETPFGSLMITNLSSFPSSLTVIPVPEGDVKKYREHFFVNENLKRLGCSGRVGLQLTTPSSATQAKFHQLYRTSDKIPLFNAVIELVKLCQAALVIFDKLKPEYADGLLCDVTEKAINDWWLEFGTDFYNVEPNDGILGPTTVAALLGMLCGARNRLSAYGAPISKDVFDLENTKRAIAYFQRSQRIAKTRRLDRPTLERLRRATAKAVSNEGWTVPRAVKSTVAELSGKGGEMVMEMVGARDKAGIADIETVDLERFVELVQGERAKWLWYGKPRKSTSGDMFSRLPEDGELLFSKDEQGGYTWSSGRRGTMQEEVGIRKRDTNDSDTRDFADFPDDQAGKRTTLKKATGRMNDARSGFGRIKDAVGRRTHESKQSREENGNALFQLASNLSRSGPHPFVAGSKQSLKVPRDVDTYPEVEISGSHGSYSPSEAAFAKGLTHTPLESQNAFFSDEIPRRKRTEQPELGAVFRDDLDEASKPPTADNSVAGSIYHGIDLKQILPEDGLYTKDIGPLLRRTQSSSRFSSELHENKNENRWPRHLSFSIAEESILTWEPLDEKSSQNQPSLTDPKKAMDRELLLAEDAKCIREQLAMLSKITGSWVEETLRDVERLDDQADRDQQELDDIYYPRLEEYQALRDEAAKIFTEERTHLQEAIKDIEVLGAKLEYEINALRSKIEDAEDGVTEFERQVAATEERVNELEQEFRDKEGWLHWIVRLLLGVGKPPVPS